MSIKSIVRIYLKRQAAGKIKQHPKSFLAIGNLRLTNEKVFTGLLAAFEMHSINVKHPSEFYFSEYLEGSDHFLKSCKLLIDKIESHEKYVDKTIANDFKYLCIPSALSNVSEVETAVTVLSTIAKEGGFVDDITLEVLLLEVSKVHVIFVKNFHAYAKLTEFFLLAGIQKEIRRSPTRITLEEGIDRYLKSRVGSKVVNKKIIERGEPSKEGDIHITINVGKYVDRNTVDDIARVMRKASKGGRTLTVTVRTREEELELKRR